MGERMEEPESGSGLNVAFLVREIAENAGQTRGIIEIVQYLHKVHPDWTFTIFTHQVSNSSFVPSYLNVRALRGYYIGLLGYPRLSSELRGFHVAYVKGTFPYVTPAIRAGLPVILLLYQVDSPRFIQGFFGKLKTVATNFLLPSMTKKVNTVLTVTDELANFYATRYKIEPVVIGEIIGAKFFVGELKQRESRLDGGGRLLSVGYWDGPGGRKRQHLLFRYLKYVVKSYPQTHLTLVGLGEKSIEELEAIADREGVRDRVSLFGVLSEDNLVDTYRNNDVYVTATTYEGFYRQAIEAFATGMPVLGFDSRSIVGDSSQAASVNHILNSRGGELFTDNPTFAESLRKIISDYSGYSFRAKAYAQKFRSEVLGQKSEELLLRVSRRVTNVAFSTSGG